MKKHNDEEKLINKVRERPLLWNKNLKVFQNTKEKRKVWEEIAKSLGRKNGKVILILKII